MTMDVSTLGIKVTSEGVKAASDSLSGLGTSAKNAETKVVSLTASVEKLMAVQKTATGAALAYAQSLQGAQQYLGGNQASTLGLETATAMLAKSMAALSANLQNVQQKSVQASAATQQHTASMRDAHAVARGLAGGLGALWLTYGNIVPMVAGVALARGFMEAAKSGAEFAYQLKFVQGLGEETAATMDRVSASILNMSKGSMFSPVEMAEGMRVLSQAGLDAANALKVLPQAMDLAVVGEMSLEKASVTLVGVMNAFNLSVADIPHVGDVFAKAAAVSQTSVEQMTNSMKTASVVGSQYGVSMEDTATALTLLAKVNITGTAAGTSLKNMLKELYAPQVQAATLMKNLGLKTSDAAGELRPMADIIYDLQKKLKDFDKVSQTQILQRLFGERGAKEAIAMLSQTREEWDKLQSSITNSDGFMRKVSSTLEDTVKGKWIQAVNTFKAQMIQAFEAMAPHLAKMADDLQAMFADESFVAGLKKIVGGVASLAATLVSLAPVIINVAEAWLVYKSAMIGAAVWSAASSAVTGFGAAMQGASVVMGPGLTTMAATRGAIAGLPALLMAVPNPLAIVAGLLAAGATAWFIWGDSASRAGDKAFDAANRAEAILAKARNRAKYGVGDLGEARKELDNAENLLGLRVQGRATGTALSDARAAVDKWSEVVNTLEAEAQKASGASTTLNNALTGKPGGRTADEVLGGNDKAAIADRYAAALETIKGKMQEINDWSKSSIAELSSLNKQGLVGDIELIEERKNVEQAAHAIEMGLIQEKIDAEAPKNRTALQQKFRNEMAALRRQDVESENKATQEIAEFFVKEEERKRQASIAGYKAEGQYVEAFLAEQGAMYSVHIAKLNRDIARETDPKKLKDLNDALKAVEDTLKKGTAAAQFKESDMAAQALIRTIEEGVTEIQAKATDGSFFGRLFAMEEMSDWYVRNLPKLEDWLEAEKHILNDGTDEAIKQYKTREIAYNKMIKHQNEIYKDFIADVDRIGMEGFQALFSSTEGSWKSYVKKMRDSFKTYLIDEIYKMLARPFVMNILANIAGAAGATGLQGALQTAAGASGGASSLLQLGRQLTGGNSSLSGMVDSFSKSDFGQSIGLSTMPEIGSTVGNGMVGTVGDFGYNALTGTVGGSTGAQLTEIGSTLSDVGSMMSSYGGYLSAGIKLLQGDIKGAAWTAAGAAIGSIIPGVGTLVGSVVGSLIGSFFGGSGERFPRTTSSAIGNYSDGSYKNESYGVGDKGERFGEGADKAMDGLVKAFTKQVGGLLDAFGLDDSIRARAAIRLRRTSGELATNFSADMGNNVGDVGNGENLETMVGGSFGKDAEDISGSIAKFVESVMSVGIQKAISVSKLPDLIKDIFKPLDGVEQVQGALDIVVNAQLMLVREGTSLMEYMGDVSSAYLRDGEQLISLVDRTIGSLALANPILEQLNQSVFALTLASGDAVSSMVDLAGGMEAFASKSGFYYENFFTADEHFTDRVDALNESFDALGYALPQSRTEFRNLVESLDLSTESGRATFISLMNLASAFAEVTPALDGATASAQAWAAAEQAIIDATTSAREANKEAWRKQFEEQKAAAEALGETYRDLAKSLTEYRTSLLLSSESSLSLGEQYTLARIEFDKTAALAKTGDVEAAGNMQAVSDAFLAASKAVAPDALAYNTDFGLVTSTLDEVISMAGVRAGATDEAILLARAQLEAQLRIADRVDEGWAAGFRMVPVPGSGTGRSIGPTGLVGSGGRNATDVITIAPKTGVTPTTTTTTTNTAPEAPTGGAIPNIFGNEVPAFASGGTHSGGWRQVGENGPELEYTGPSTIISNNNSKALFDNSDMVAAINQLRQEMQAANISIAQSNQRIAKMVERWDGDGMPEVRDVAA